MEFKGVFILVCVVFCVLAASPNRLRRSTCQPCVCTDVYLDCSDQNLGQIPQINQRDINRITILDLSKNKLRTMDIGELLNYPRLKFVYVYDNPDLCEFLCASGEVERLRIQLNIAVESDCVCDEPEDILSTPRVVISTEATIDAIITTADPFFHRTSSTSRRPIRKRTTTLPKPKPKVDPSNDDPTTQYDSTTDSESDPTTEYDPTTVNVYLMASVQYTHQSVDSIDGRLVFITILTVVTALLFVIIMLALYCCGNCIRMFKTCRNSMKIAKCCKICNKKNEMRVLTQDFGNLNLHQETPPNVFVQMQDENVDDEIEHENIPLNDPFSFSYPETTPRQRRTPSEKSHPM